MQDFMLELLFREKMMKRDQKYYRSNTAFYRTISYLKIAGMIASDKKEQFNEYRLTEKGKLFAVWLCGLPDNSFMVQEFEKKFGESEELDIARAF